MKKLIFVLMLVFLAPTIQAVPPFRQLVKHMEWKRGVNKRHRQFKKRKKQNVKRQKAVQQHNKKKGGMRMRK